MPNPFGAFDPLDPYLGAYGPRSLTGRGRGSPAGGLPVQARDANPLSLTRERLQDELANDPRLRNTFDANTTAEVGTDPGKRRWYQALTIDRAAATGKPLSEVVNNPNYYPETTTRATATTGIGTDPSLWTGDNPANFATGNASYDPKKQRYVGFAGGPQTSSYGSSDRGSEYGGIEGGTMPYARAVGYTGPERTAIGPGGPRGNEDELTAGLDPSATPREAATYPRQPGGRKMPSSLMDFLNPDSYQAKDQITGQPISFGDAIGRNSNALIGAGLGLLQMQPLGGSGMANALKGYQGGAALDQRAQALRQEEAQRKQEQSNWEKQFGLREREFERSDPANAPTEFTRAARDLRLTPGTPEHTQFAKQFYASKSEGNLTAQAEQRAAIAKAQGLDVNEPRVKAWIAAGGAHLTDEPKALPAELAARTAVGANFLDQAPALRKQIESGLATNDPIAKAKTLYQVGDQGNLVRSMQSGTDALLRHMTGQGMSVSEAQKYIQRYELTLKDTKNSALDKFDRLTTELTRIEQEAYRGRGGIPKDIMERRQAIQKGQGTPTTAPAPAAGPTKTIGSKTYRKIDGQWFED